jgi:hypothetical protein
MTATSRLTILGFLILATAMEVSGDAIVRMGIAQPGWKARAALFVAGAALLFGYGLCLNLAPIAFEKVVGVYIAVLFVVWQVIGFIAFRTVPTLPTVVGGALIVAGGLVVAFWQAGAEAA